MWPVLQSSGESEGYLIVLRLSGRLICDKTNSFRLRDGLKVIENSSDVDQLAGSVKDTGGLYFVTAFSGLLAPCGLDWFYQ